MIIHAKKYLHFIVDKKISDRKCNVKNNSYKMGKGSYVKNKKDQACNAA
jgi:hypothetical protein